MDQDFDQFLADVFHLLDELRVGEQDYLSYLAASPGGDEANVVDRLIGAKLLAALGYREGELDYNLQKNRWRPDWVVRIPEYGGTCFVVEDEATTDSLDTLLNVDRLQLEGYVRAWQARRGLLTNGDFLLGYEFFQPGEPTLLLNLSLRRFYEQRRGVALSPDTDREALYTLWNRFRRANFADVQTLLNEFERDEATWRQQAERKDGNPHFETHLIDDVKRLISSLESDVLHQLQVRLEEYRHYLEESERLPKLEDPRTYLEGLAWNILDQLDQYGLLPEERTPFQGRLLEHGREAQQFPNAEVFAQEVLRLINAARLRLADRLEAHREGTVLPNHVQRVLTLETEEGAAEAAERRPNSVERQVQALRRPLKQLPRRLADDVANFDRVAREFFLHRRRLEQLHGAAIQTYRHYSAWREILSATVLHGADEAQTRREFALQTAYVYLIRLLLVRICEDKGIFQRKLSNGNFRDWMESIAPRYFDYARGTALDYLLEVSYANAQNIYAHFYQGRRLFGWYNLDEAMLVRLLHRLNRYDLSVIDEDIIGRLYAAYVDTYHKHERGQYFTPVQVVDYILDSVGYTPDNPAIVGARLCDLSGGSGSFLVRATRRLLAAVRGPRPTIPPDEARAAIDQVKQSFYMLDINPFNCYLAETNLFIQVLDLIQAAHELGQPAHIDRFHVYTTDTLALPLPDASPQQSMLDLGVLAEEQGVATRIKLGRGEFAAGFDFMVGNPPYVRAHEKKGSTPEGERYLAYREQLRQSGHFKTLHKKWDLYIPFIELNVRRLKAGGKPGLIVSSAFETATYAELCRKLLVERLTLRQIDFFPGVRLFEDAAVFNTILIAENVPPTLQTFTERRTHRDASLDLARVQRETRSQLATGEAVFRQNIPGTATADTVPLNDLCYISVGMVLSSDERRYPNEFQKDDLISPVRDEQHPVAYVEGRDLASYAVKSVRYLEYGPGLRAPECVDRPTFPELYDRSKLLRGRTSAGIYDDGQWAEGWWYCNHSVICCVPWHSLEEVKNSSVERQRKQVKPQSSLSRQFDLRYLLALMNSTWGDRFLQSVRTSSCPEEIESNAFKQMPIKHISLHQQQPFIDLVDEIQAINRELGELQAGGYGIKGEEVTVPLPVFLPRWQETDAAHGTPVVDFLSATWQQLFAFVGEDLHRPIGAVKFAPGNLLAPAIVRGETGPLFTSPHEPVLHYLAAWLNESPAPQPWTDLRERGKIPGAAAAVEQCLAARQAEADRVRALLRRRGEIGQQLDQLVERLYAEPSVED